MPNVVFVAPFFLETTLRFVEAATTLDGVRLGLVSQDPSEKLPAAMRSRLACHLRIADGLDARAIAAAVEALGGAPGGIDVLLGTLEELQVPLAKVREHLGIDGMGVEAARSFRDKARMKSILRQADVPCARHRLAASSEAAWEFADEVGFPQVIKPPAGAGARSTFRLDGPDALAATLRSTPPSVEHPALLEEFIVGEEHSFDSVCIDGEMVWHSVNDYLPTPLDVLRNPWIQWCVLSPRDVYAPRYDDIRVLATRALKVLGMQTGISHLEWFRRTDGTIAISEVAARPPGAQFTTLISYADDFDLYKAWARVMVYKTFEVAPRRFAAGAAFLRGQGQGRVKAIHGIETANQRLGELVVESRLPRPGQTATGTYEGDGYVILRHTETAVVADALRNLVELIRVELG